MVLSAYTAPIAAGLKADERGNQSVVSTSAQRNTTCLHREHSITRGAQKDKEMDDYEFPAYCPFIYRGTHIDAGGPRKFGA